MNAKANKGCGQENPTGNAQGAMETRVAQTVDHRSSAGQGQEVRDVKVIHQLHPSEKSTTSGGVLAGAAAAVSSTLESARDAISHK
ncbi:hypothetical protein FEM48_Zijuj08G0123200 [Ziziphus jujuba var. spinosa]|uniref:Uncharacterized protein n=1 Tax=Ziziphus jujuba var. spinosa TaxID=714518 RepID=A0A978UZ24_ZIZJJ|nr:hypothetical protein FEM48_Zijuj08G0123200 [Ziziphus jujuba var. spinosa]